MSDVAFVSATELARRIRAREIGVRELTDLTIDRIERLDAELNAVVVRDFERAREAATRADAALAAGEEVGPLHGVPMTIKESYDVAGLPTTWGDPLFAGNTASSDSEAVRAFRGAGVVLLGKTNVPIHLADFQSYNEIYGTTRNPWDPSRIPGGSSGGSACALAAGLVGIECGSDIGGSIRNPAHYCGVYGHKPTWGVVPPQGHALPGMVAGPDIAVCGPLARSAEDLALALGVLAGPEPLDRRGWKLDLPQPRERSLAGFRVAIWPDDPRSPVDAEIADRAAGLGETLAKLGAVVSDAARPEIDFGAAHETYLTLLHSIMGAGMPEKDRESTRAAVAELSDGDRSDLAVMLRSMVLSHADWLRANHARERLRHAWRDFFRDWDVVICPQSATPAFEHDHRPMPERTLEIGGEPRPYFEQLFWAGIATAPYLPSTVFPTGPSRAGLPIGLQAIGAEYHDLVTIDFARLLAAEIGGFEPPPRCA